MKLLQIKDCPLCGKIIWKFKRPSLNITTSSISFNFKSIPYAMNEKGTIFFVLLTDGTRMQVAICKDCLKNITLEQVKRIFADITFTKLKAIEKDKRVQIHYKLFDRIRTIEVVTYAETEQEIVEFIEARK